MELKSRDWSPTLQKTGLGNLIKCEEVLFAKKCKCYKTFRCQASAVNWSAQYRASFHVDICKAYKIIGLVASLLGYLGGKRVREKAYDNELQ